MPQLVFQGKYETFIIKTLLLFLFNLLLARHPAALGL